MVAQGRIRRFETVPNREDRNSNRLWKQNMVATTGFDEQYTVDNLNRLTQMKRGTLNGSHVIPGTPVKQQDWGLDPVGNWNKFGQDVSGTTVLDQTRATSTVNEITSIGTGTGGLPVWATPTYDAAGNMTGFVKPSNLAANLTGVYDAWNRLVAVKDGANFVTAYAYDGLRRRVVKKFYVGGTLKETRDFYLSDQWQVLSEVVGGVVDKTYAWGLRYVDELLWRDDPKYGRLYAMQDANFNCTAICDTSGSVVERYQFDPYGNRVVLNPSWSVISASAYDWAVAHQGLMLETDVGLYNCRNRVYSPLLGVWLQRDPLEYTDNSNLYIYLDDNPIVYTDSFGANIQPIMVCGPPPPPPEGITCVLTSDTLEQCLSCCVYNPGNGEVSWLPCAEMCFRRDWTKPLFPQPGTTPGGGGGGLNPRPWTPDYSCQELVSQLAWGAWGDHLDGNDKFQHCYTSCRLSQSCGRALAGLLGTLREHVSWMKDDSQLDLVANEKGIYCAGHECKSSGYVQPNADCCKHCCSQSYPPRGPDQPY